MRKIILAVAVTATLPGLTAGDPPKDAKVNRSPGGAKPADKAVDKRKAPAEGANVQKPGSKQADKWSPNEGKQTAKPGKEFGKLSQSKPSQNPEAKEPGKLEQKK
ncbi:MAG: hypothetical protein Q8O00_06865 [Holophaga sp.]|nr:hypothetical protein [Holophaga sp.]